MHLGNVLKAGPLSIQLRHAWKSSLPSYYFFDSSKELRTKRNMASILSYVPVVNRFISTKDASPSIDIPPVEVHNVETAPEKRSRTLKHLLKANHINHSILFHDRRFHNHLPHILCSAYLLGASDAQLHHVYAEEAKTLEPWEPSPAEVTQDDWQSYWGDKRYQRAFVDFFEDALVMRHSYNWKKVVDEYLFAGKEPLVNCLIGGRTFLRLA